VIGTKLRTSLQAVKLAEALRVLGLKTSKLDGYAAPRAK